MSHSVEPDSGELCN